jgi:hypothetical protein
VSHRDEEELLHGSRDAEEQLRRLVGSVGGVDLVATALRLHPQEWSLLHEPLLSPDEIFLGIAQGRAHAIKALRAGSRSSAAHRWQVCGRGVAALIDPGRRRVELDGPGQRTRQRRGPVSPLV